MRDSSIDPDMSDDLDARLAGYISNVYIPQNWTPEYVGYRLIEAFKTLRNSSVRGGISSKTGFWPQYFHTAQDLKGWAEEYRAQVEADLAAASRRPSRQDLSLMDDALSWPLRFLSSDPEMADAVTLWAWTTAYDIDLVSVLKQRKHHAFAQAQSIASEISGKLMKAKREKTKEVTDWANQEFIDRKVGSMQPKKREKETARIRAVARAKLERELGRLRALHGVDFSGDPAKALAAHTITESKRVALDVLAVRLNAHGVAVR